MFQLLKSFGHELFQKNGYFLRLKCQNEKEVEHALFLHQWENINTLSQYAYHTSNIELDKIVFSVSSKQKFWDDNLNQLKHFSLNDNDYDDKVEDINPTWHKIIEKYIKLNVKSEWVNEDLNKLRVHPSRIVVPIGFFILKILDNIRDLDLFSSNIFKLTWLCWSKMIWVNQKIKKVFGQVKMQMHMVVLQVIF